MTKTRRCDKSDVLRLRTHFPKRIETFLYFFLVFWYLFRNRYGEGTPVVVGPNHYATIGSG